MRMRGGRVITELFPKPHIGGGGGCPMVPPNCGAKHNCNPGTALPKQNQKDFLI